MARKVRTAKGELIDFDLLKIKEQIASAPPSIDVQQRQNFIDKRLRRRLKKAQQNVSKTDVNVEEPIASPPEQPIVTDQQVVSDAVVEPVDQIPTKPKRNNKKKQKARKKNI